MKQTSTDKNIAELEEKIKLLQIETKRLQTEHEVIKRELNDTIKNTQKYPENCNHNNEKYVVLHGLALKYNENDDELFDRVSYIFYDILNINISQYIEDITVIGKKGSRNPLKIELNTRRLRNHILKNASYFRYNGLGVSEYLSASDLKERRELKRSLQEARKNGHHAIIRGNKLIINGRLSDVESRRATITSKEDHNTTRENNTQHSDTGPNTNLQISSKKNHSFRQ